MEIVNNISNLDEVIVIGKDEIVNKIYQFRPDTQFLRSQGYPESCLKVVGESLNGYVLETDMSYTLTIDKVNEGLETSYVDLVEFFGTLAEDEYLII